MLPIVEIKDLSIDFISGTEKVNAVNNISFNVNRGELVAIVGESGSGKSVTALSILQLLPTPPAVYNSGQILFSSDGNSSIELLTHDRRSLQQIRGNRISMIFQEPMTSLNPVLRCGEQVVESLLTHKRIDQGEAKKRTIEWFSRVKLPNPERIFKSYPHQLSGGQKQRVMIAMAMCCDPSLLICDEPTTALDVTVQKTILDLIKQLQQEENLAVIFITHDLGVVAEIADRTIVMYKGSIVEENNIRELFRFPKHPYTKALLACRPVNHPRGERLPVVADFLKPEMLNIEHRTRNIEQGTSNIEQGTSNVEHQIPNPQTPKLSNADLIQVQNLSVWFPIKKSFLGKTTEYLKAVDDISFEIKKGETVGLVGESGCGKTTLGRSLLRLIEPTSGKIIYDGKELTAMKTGELRPLRKDLQIIFQDPYSSLNPRLTIGSAISEALKVHEPGSSAKQRKDRVQELLEKVDLRKEHFNRYPHEFSGGQRQRIVIARALALDPSFLVCDESVSALDVSVQAQVLNLLNDLKKELGFTVVFISHDLSVVRYISDRILVMNQGRIVESGPADEVYYRPQNEYTRKLIDSIPKGVEH